VVTWSGNNSTAWQAGWRPDYLTGLPQPAFGEVWTCTTVTAYQTRYDARVAGDGVFAIIARADIPVSQGIRGTLTYIAAS